MKDNKPAILLIGGNGYIGSHLTRTLSEKYTVFYTGRNSKEQSEENYLIFDILKPETYKNISTKNYEFICLLASSLAGLGTRELKTEFLEVNTNGYWQILQYIHEQKLSQRIVYISSMTVYGKNNNVPVAEYGVLEPLSTYGLGKVMAEQLVSFFCNTEERRGVSLRIPGVYGGDRKAGFIYNTTVKCLKNETIELDLANLGYWESIHVEDLCLWISEFIQHYDWAKQFDYFNLGYGVPTDIVDCAFEIKKVLHSSSEIKVKNRNGYIEFYLDNDKIKKYVTIQDKYFETLNQYVKSISV